MVMHLAFAGERAHSSVRLPGATLHVYQLYIKNRTMLYLSQLSTIYLPRSGEEKLSR